jgi:hypothetical protein
MPGVIPNLKTLAAAKGKQFTLGIGTPHINAGGHCLEVSRKANVTAGGAVSVDESGDGNGIWVPYVPDRATYGFSMGGAGWMGTGPFSGCHIAFFTKGGRIGMAHIAKPSDAAAAAWDTFRAGNDVMVLNEWKVPLPDQTKFSASYLFLDLANPSAVAVTQVDVHVRGMGGSDGPIFEVKKLV